MNTKNPLPALFSMTCAAMSVCAQGSFENLDFESAILDPVPVGQDGGHVPISDGLPGWTGYIGSNQVTVVLHNDVTLGAPSIDILGPNLTNDVVIDGLYTAVIQAGVFPPSPPVSASIAQSGLVPAGTRSIEFKGKGGIPSVSLGGQPISIVAIGSGPNYTLYGGDVSEFAGQVAELRFTSFPPSSSPTAMSYIDSIEFSPSSIPEPALPAVLSLGAAVLCWRFFRQRGNVSAI